MTRLCVSFSHRWHWLLLLWILVFYGCGIDETSFASDAEFLEVVLPPCVPYPGSNVDPCERRDSWPKLNPYVDASYELIQPAPTLEEAYLGPCRQRPRPSNSSFVQSRFLERLGAELSILLGLDSASSKEDRDLWK